MIKLFLSVFVILFSSQLLAADNFLGHAKDRGVLITVTTDKSIYVTGDKVKFQGKIRVVNKAQANQSGGKKTDLLEEFKQQGIDIVASYPNEIFNVTPDITIEGINSNEIKFSFESEPMQEGQNGQFSLKVFNNHQNKEKLKKISQIKAKIERRLLALNALLNSHVVDNSSQDVISYLKHEIAKLQNIVQKISSRMNSDENLMAENTVVVQVNNETAASSHISTVMNRYRFLIETTPGIVIEGNQVKIDAKVTNLRQSDQDYSVELEDTVDSYKSADFILDGEYLFTSPQKKMFPGSTITYSYETSNLTPTQSHTFSVSLFNVEDNKRASRVGSLSQNISVLNDTVSPVWANGSHPSLNNHYVQNMEPISMILDDRFGRIDPSLVAKLNGSGTSGDVTQFITAEKVGDGQSYNYSGNLNPLSEGDYTFEVTARDLAGNAAVPNPYSVQFRVDRTIPIVNIAQINPLTNQNSTPVLVNVNDLSPVTTKIYVNDELKFTSASAEVTENVPLNLEGENIIRVVSSDAAGNISSPSIVSVVRDTIPPILSNILPTQNSKLFQYQFSVSGASNEPLSAVIVDGVSFSLSTDKKSFSGNYVSNTPGIQTLNILATDLAGNTSVATLTLDIQPKLLNPELISLFADADSRHVFIKGNVGAARPGAEIKASTGFFSLN